MGDGELMGAELPFGAIKNVLEISCGDGYPTVGWDLMLLNCALKNSQNDKFYCHSYFSIMNKYMNKGTMGKQKTKNKNTIFQYYVMLYFFKTIFLLSSSHVLVHFVH